ncbi:Uncharacterised protein [Vibrio cholerae]|nr:Uncharacterised protein [Vibrio cholerae]
MLALSAGNSILITAATLSSMKFTLLMSHLPPFS